MKRAEQTEIRARIVIERPVPGVLHSLQEDDAPLDPKRSQAGEPLAFDFPLRIAPPKDGAGPKFYGKQVRPEGPGRRFVFIRVGTHPCHRRQLERPRMSSSPCHTSLLAQCVLAPCLSFEGHSP